MGLFDTPTKETLQKDDLRTQCQFVFFDWKKKENLNSKRPNYSELSQSTAYDLSPYILSAGFSKNKEEAAGHFSITLKNDRDWKETIKPGTWALLYLTQDGDLAIPEKSNKPNTLASPNIKALQAQKHKLRAMLYIETIKASGTNENGVFDITYTLSGRDFGIIYEATEIWLNMFYFEETVRNSFLNAVTWADLKTVDQLLTSVHNFFIAPHKIHTLSSNSEFSKIGQQWIMPNLLLKALDLKTSLGDSSFFGNIRGVLKFSKTLANVPISNPLTYIEGTAWEKLKTLSIPILHELFCEIENGSPLLTFRPIPWAVNPVGYPTLATVVPFYKNLIVNTAVRIPTIHILNFDLTENDHNRFNHFLFDIQNQAQRLDSGLIYLQTPSKTRKLFPFAQLESIARHGLRRMHQVAEFLINFFVTDPGNLIKEYNELLLDYYNNAIFYEDGTMEIIGNSDIRIGKTIYIPDADYNAGKAFYIEGYEDVYSAEDGVSTWTQNLILTRGMELDNLTTQKFKNRANPLKNIGDFK